MILWCDIMYIRINMNDLHLTYISLAYFMRDDNL